MEKVRKSCGLLNGIEIEAEGTRRGLCLAWKDDIEVTLRSFSKWHINVVVKEDDTQEEWQFTGLYGSPYLKDQDLKRNYPWLVVEDFNEIMYSFEKRGLLRDQKRMEVFGDTLEECQLMDIGYSRVCRLSRDRNFYFEVWWTLEESFEEILKEIWESSSDPLMEKLRNLEIGLTQWANTIKGKKGELRKRLTKELETSKKEDVDDEMSKIIDMKIHLNMEIVKDEAYWEQRARYWHIVGKEVLEYCLGVLNKGTEVDSANTTNIVLILKVQKPTSLVNFRPISLCTVLYKLVAKTIVNRMQDVMGTCIDQVQSGFVPGRLISDNILLAYEILHMFRQKRTGNEGFMAVKLDMSKAYDRVEWEFIKEVMNKMGFARNWIELIMNYYNETRGRAFQPSRGLRQVDPLSPFLFLICSEGLSALMRSAKKNGLIKREKASKKGQRSSIYYLQMIVSENCSGQCVNFDKSTIFYSSNTNEESKVTVSLEKYLGLPNMVGRRKKEAFQNQVDRIASRIEGLSSRLLSQWGKKFSSSQYYRQFILLLSCFLFPKAPCERIETVVTIF
ncbi:reverse transcriptase [Gossypium australe]|uniref:Reverse transcriptase n=1 Tax=Gossypium australe TaxID=47621 RepID=A0A5B6W617_9ROSI|nr:reverse transcriptase [Gossypium australe]